MTEQQRGVLTLIKSALDGKGYPLPEAFDMAQAVHIAMRHKLIALIYYGAVNCGIDRQSEPMRKLFPALIVTMNVVQKQCFEQQRLCDAFLEKGIDHMLMKGALIQRYYPLPEMRTMGDLDILIRTKQYERIAPVMAELGYSYCYESNHELVWRRGKVDVELHKCVIPTYDTDYYGYFGTGWSLAKETQPSSYALSDEDFYVYIFAHMSKHYRMAGIGIKHFVDLWVYERAKPQLDKGYIRKALEKMNLATFYDYVQRTLETWFNDAAATEQSDYITHVVFENAEYGLAENRHAAWVLLQAQKEGSVSKVKRRNHWATIFPQYSTMCNQYPALKKAPVLLPVYWVIRWCSVVFTRRKDLEAYQATRRAQTNQKIEQRRRALEFVGLEFAIDENSK